MIAFLLAMAVALAGTSAVGTPVFENNANAGISANGDEFHASAMQALAQAGLATAAASEADYQIDLRVQGVQIRYKAPRAAEVAVEWRVSERASGAVVYDVITRGYAENDEADPDLHGLGVRAFADAAERFATRPRLAAAVAGSPRGTSADRTLHYRACTRPPLKLPSEITDAFDAIVVVQGGSAIGTGVTISPDGFILTAAHVVPKGVDISVTTHAGNHLPAELVRRDTVQDIALLHVSGAPPSCLALRSMVPSVGSDLFVVGTPAGLDYSVSKGVVSGIRTMEEYRFLQTDASISPGNSGGPMLDTTGGVLAIVSWKIKAAGFEGIGFGVPGLSVEQHLALQAGARSDTTYAPFPDGEAAALDPAVVDTPDSSRFAVAAQAHNKADHAQARRKKGVALFVVGAVVVGATAYEAGAADHASDLLWGTLGVANSAGWVGMVGGAALVGLSFKPLDAEGPRMVTVTRRF